MVVFVTAFYSVRADVRMDSYITEFRKIADTGVPVLLFRDPDENIPDLPANVRQIPMPFVRYSAVQLPRVRNEEKDTADFMSLMLMKLRCMKEALAYTDASHLAWIDLRVFHVILQTERVQQQLLKLSRAPLRGLLTRIAAPGCWNPTPENFDIFNHICWRWCGGFFVGPREIFPAAYKRQTELVEAHLPRLTWEVNYWTMMEEYFVWYIGDHNESLIMNLPYI